MEGENAKTETAEAVAAESVEATAQEVVDGSEAAPGGEQAPPATEKPAEAAKPDETQERLRQLMAKEGALVRERQKLAAQAKDVEGVRQAKADFDALRELAPQDPLAALEKLGVPVDVVKARIADLESTDPVAKVSRELEAMKKAQSEREAQERRDAESREVESRRQQHRAQLAAHIQGKAEEYQYVTAYGEEGIDLVQQTVLRHLAKTQAEGNPRVLTHDEAAQAVETYLEKRYVEPLLKTKKIAQRLPPASAAKPAGAPAAKTIDNGMVPGKTVDDKPARGPREGETPDEYYERFKRENGLVRAPAA